MEGERLLYPMMQVPIEMINGREGTSLVSAVFRQPQMWIGFALPVIVGCCNALHNYYPQWPGLYFRSSMYLFRDTINLPFEFSFSLVGFSYFINRNLAWESGFSICWPSSSRAASISRRPQYGKIGLV